MFYRDSDNRRTISPGSLSGRARIAGMSPDGPGPVGPHWRISAPSLAGSTSNPTSRGHRRADDVPDPSGIGLRLRRPRTGFFQSWLLRPRGGLYHLASTPPAAPLNTVPARRYR